MEKIDAAVGHLPMAPKGGRLLDIWRYPVSSLAGERLEMANLIICGVQGDRQYGYFERQGSAHIYPARDARWNAAPQISARLTAEGPQLAIESGQWVGARDPAADAWLAAMFGHAVDLRSYDDVDRPRYTRAPLHLLSVQALNSLQRLLPDSTIDASRFRPNLLVDLPDLQGDIPEYALLGREFTVGNVRLRATIPCGRCGFTTLPTADLPQDPDILRTLVRRYQRNFGIYCEVIEPGDITVGAPLTYDCARNAVVIVGGGQAGATVALALRRLGHTDPIRIIAAERHLPYERPPLSKQVLNLCEVAPPIMTAQEAARANITIDLATPVEALDLQARQLETADGNVIRFDTLILATGGRVRRQAGLNRGHGRVHELRLRDDAERLGRVLQPGTRLFILGGGWIGMEMAAVARMAGAEVDLFMRSARFAPRVLPEVVAETLSDLHLAHGVRVHPGATPVFLEHDTGISCRLGDMELNADHLIAAIGMVPNDGLARRAGLDCDDGIRTDEIGATGQQGVFAIGDVARPPSGRVESWQNADRQAKALACHIQGMPLPKPETLRFWSDQFGHRLQIVGRPDPQATLVAESDGFWDFGDFAIGIDRPEQIHRVSRRLAGVQSPQSAAPQSAAVRRIEHRLCASDELPDGALVRIVHPTHGPLCATRQAGQVHVTDDRCPHAVASLAQGFVDGGRLICPLHFAEFDLTDGSPHHAPEGCGALMIHPATERDGEIFVDLPV